jgi:hypothetical protein
MGIERLQFVVPETWDAAWFQRVFVTEILSKLDTRNATPGSGVSISSSGNSVATIATSLTDSDIPATIARDTEVTAAIAAHAAEANPHPTYLTQAEGDALYEPTASILAVTTVGALPVAAAGNQGVRCMVTDANATTFLSTVAAGGANIVPVISNGTVWVIG